jgi:nicotinate-nucleotide pyrophosphorylase (carboxylating)
MDRLDWTAIDKIIDLALEEDLGSGDITTHSTVSSRAWGKGSIIARKKVVVAGLFLVDRLYRQLDSGVQVEVITQDGSRARTGDVLCNISGPYQALLSGERVVLNLLQRTCGIATYAARYARAVKGTEATVFDTRKTTPGMRTLDKYAVRTGGAANHRMGLFDALLIKENHIAAAGGVDKAINLARKAHPEATLEIEVQNLEELVLATEYGADIVLLDNMTPVQVRKAVRLVGKRVQLEVSGGVTLKNVKEMAATGVPRISVGALTHSAPAADLSMLLLPARKP